MIYEHIPPHADLSLKFACDSCEPVQKYVLSINNNAALPERMCSSRTSCGSENLQVLRHLQKGLHSVL